MILHQIYFLDKEKHVDYLIEDDKYNNRFNAGSNSKNLLLEKSTFVFQIEEQKIYLIKCSFDESIVRLFMIQLISEFREYVKYNQRLESLFGFKIKLHKSFEKMVVEKLDAYISYSYSPNEYVMIYKTSLESINYADYWIKKIA